MKRDRDSAKSEGSSTKQQTPPESMPTYVILHILGVAYSLGFGLDRMCCPEPSAAQDGRLGSFPFSPSILVNESHPFTAWAELTASSPLPDDVTFSVELADNKGSGIVNGLSMTDGTAVSLMTAKFDRAGSARTSEFGIHKTSCKVYGCLVKEFKVGNTGFLQFRFSAKIDNEEVFSYYSPGYWVLSKAPSRKKLQHLINAQRSMENFLRRTTCYFGDISRRSLHRPERKIMSRAPRYTIRVYYPVIDIETWSAADANEHIARCMGRVSREIQAHCEERDDCQTSAESQQEESQQQERPTLDSQTVKNPMSNPSDIRLHYQTPPTPSIIGSSGKLIFERLDMEIPRSAQSYTFTDLMQTPTMDQTHIQDGDKIDESRDTQIHNSFRDTNSFFLSEWDDENSFWE